MNRLFVAVSLGILMWACGDNPRPLGPTSPSAPQGPVAPAGTYTLSGVISETTPTGQTPVEGVRVATNVGFATTDRTGFYTIPGLSAGIRSILVTKDDYETVRTDVSITGDTRLDLQIVRRATHTLSGVVSEVTPTGLYPVEGVRVDESYFHASVTTDKDGFYSFTGPYGTGINNTVVFSKEGYQPATRAVLINGDTRLDIQLVRR